MGPPKRSASAKPVPYTDAPQLGEHFATLFKREHDITPLKYRSKVRGR